MSYKFTLLNVTKFGLGDFFHTDIWSPWTLDKILGSKFESKSEETCLFPLRVQVTMINWCNCRLWFPIVKLKLRQCERNSKLRRKKAKVDFFHQIFFVLFWGCLWSIARLPNPVTRLSQSQNLQTSYFQCDQFEYLCP
jgi:hypothetical protein